MTRGTREKKLGVLLAVSVAANLFLGSIIAGRWIGERSQSAQAAHALRELVAPLPVEKRAIVLKEVRAVMPQIRQSFEGLQAARAAMGAEFAKPTLDQPAIDRHFAEIRARTTAIQAQLQAAFGRAAASLTQAERSAVLEAIRRREPSQLPEI